MQEVTVKMEPHESCIRLGHNDVLKGIVQVSFPQRGTAMFLYTNP